MKTRLWIALFLCFFAMNAVNSRAGDVPKKRKDFSERYLQVSANGRFLQYDDGTPFFYLGDTAWELFHRLTREEVDYYLADRAQKGFTVIQAVALAEFDGVESPNAYGFFPLLDKNPQTPDVKDGADNDYWDHVDYVVKKANELGLYIGLLPTWGRYWHDEHSTLFDEASARSYGRFIGERYKEAKIIWILGGDRNPEHEQHKLIIRAMAQGIKESVGEKHLLTYHPTGWCGSGQFFHSEDWLDFNMRQNGHEVEYTSYGKLAEDYQRTPIKPVIDGEPLYEDHPVAFQADSKGHSIASDVRRSLYWDLFQGAFGHTYGHHSVWQMYDPDKRQPVNNPLLPWREALDQPGSSQMLYGRLLMESRPFFTRIPATDRVIKEDRVPTAVPGTGRYRLTATCDAVGTYIMIYVPVGRTFTVNTGIIKGEKIKAWWYNPRNGKATLIGTFANEGEHTFQTPDPGEMIDWILVLDDASLHYAAPGRIKSNH